MRGWDMTACAERGWRCVEEDGTLCKSRWRFFLLALALEFVELMWLLAEEGRAVGEGAGDVRVREEDADLAALLSVRC